MPQDQLLTGAQPDNRSADDRPVTTAVSGWTPIAPPYHVGAPVPPARLVGRQALLAQLEAAQATPGPRETLVIVGPRRAGKTSLVRAIPHACRLEDDTRVAFLILQSIDWSDGLSELCQAIALALWDADPAGLNEPALADYDSQPLAALHAWLTRLGAFTPRRRYLLLLDEYELLDELPAGAGADLLRALTGQRPWLALGLVGLRGPAVCSAAWRTALGPWRSLSVGRLDQAAFADLLQGHDTPVPLTYRPDAIDRAYRLIGGQPFLGQLLGSSLLQRFHASLTPPPTVTAAAVDAIVEAPAFGLGSEAYLRPLWALAGEPPPGQQALLTSLAEQGKGLALDTWHAHSGVDPATFTAAMAVLQASEIVTVEQGVCRYRIELMRRQVAAGPWASGVSADGATTHRQALGLDPIAPAVPARHRAGAWATDHPARPRLAAGEGGTADQAPPSRTVGQGDIVADAMLPAGPGPVDGSHQAPHRPPVPATGTWRREPGGRV